MKKINLKQKLNALSDNPGIYIFKDKDDKIIYIGKAKNLKKRVMSYFRKTGKDLKTSKLTGNIRDFDYIITNNEMEAFLLEGTLIKQHQPHYNVLLKDDKTFPFIKITTGEQFPGVYFTRNTKEKKAVYYGPYIAEDAKIVLELIYKIFKVRQCNYNFEKKQLTRPCVFYDMHICTAPCAGLISGDNYQNSIKEVKKFLNGNYKGIIEKLQEDMRNFSLGKQYEKAAEIRDQIKAVEDVMQKQAVVLSENMNVDVIDFVRQDLNAYFCVLNVRSGRLVSRRMDVFNDVINEEDVFETYLMQYYNRNISYPDEIILRDGLSSPEIMESFFYRKKINLTFKKKDKLLDLARENILQKIRYDMGEAEKQKIRERTSQKQLDGIKKVLGLDKTPEMIDAIDVSHFSGDNIVASCVVFKNGEPEKKLYRRYKIKGTVKIDDYAAIKEVVMRRYGRMLKENAKFPDMVLIDGGIGQVNAAKQGLNMIGVENLHIIGLAKKKEEVFLPGKSKPIDVPADSRLILQKIRDEAHRFAVSFQTLLANKKLKKMTFDDIPFIGEKTRYNIYSQFKNSDELINAIETNDKRADFLTNKQKKEILNRLKGRKNEI
ncbi:MAG: excinuclease ABC subunit UvrC [Candidatus Goldbacteria bacterium]|nr:excinuclease ABC subunit UvrC [Candidatus Goldiibacteriota bacterium]